MLTPEKDKQAKLEQVKPGPSVPSAAEQATVIKFEKEKLPDRFMPTLSGANQTIYEVRAENFLLSVVTHTAALALLFFLLHIVPPKIKPALDNVITLVAPTLEVGKGGPSGGGGGDRSKLQASKGAAPKFAKQPIVPPEVIVQQKSKLMVEPAIVADLRLPSNTQMGDPLSKLMAPSNGPGSHGGIGSGDGGGVGSGFGPGAGPGMCCGSGVSEPRPIFTPDPEFSEEARKAKYQGLVGLVVVVGVDGRIHDARVARSLGLGLDEKALEVVKLWKFEPAKMNGRPVAVRMAVEVDFHLY